MFPIYAVN